MPTISNFFNLWPYIMFYNTTVTIDDLELMQFQYSYPLGSNTNHDHADEAAGQEFIVYIEQDTLDINRIVAKDPTTME
jgi:hypothetical protein